ncbi:hypothetical protein AVEN_270009-1 [Araneus ventricosus]|uniref:Uncharacterized protein n=1 Tax=Araneus ventricosus TaxID=182803 RepID=A0A4Y2FCB0_ARAVE|nr:hypothetical protein AVEN_270009-1 [Araneus ventricosus]
MYIRYETDRHESACVQGTHRLQKTEHFQNRSTRIGVYARNASSAKVDYFQTGLQKSVCVQVAIVSYTLRSHYLGSLRLSRAVKGKREQFFVCLGLPLAAGEKEGGGRQLLPLSTKTTGNL